MYTRLCGLLFVYVTRLAIDCFPQSCLLFGFCIGEGIRDVISHVVLVHSAGLGS